MNKRIISLILVVVLMFPQAMAGATEEVPDSEVNIEETVEAPEGEAPIEPEPEPTEISEELHCDQLAETAEQTRTVVASGTCGDNVAWTLYDDGELYIAGSGRIQDYNNNRAPWYADYCSQIITVKIEQGVTDIGDYAFHGCNLLTSITIPEGVTSIGSYAFSGCSSLTSITIPESVTSIWGSAFGGCSSLMSITIPESMKRISVYAFSGCSSLTSITIPGGVTDIGSYAFRYCSSLASITISKSVTSIGSAAFNGCSNLQDVFFAGTEADRRAISINSSNSSNTTLLNAEWHYINSVDEVFTISVEQPANGTVTSSKAMCVAGMEITVGAKPDAGYRLRTIIVDGEPIEGTSFTAGGNHVVTAEFEPYRTEGIVKSGTCGAFLTWTLYDDGELYIAGSGRMKDYSNIDDNRAPWYADYRSQITTVTIEQGVTSIGDYAFHCCSSLMDITIPEGVRYIDSHAFTGCSSLTSITIPEGVSYISSYAFSDCHSLMSITIPTSVTSINYDAFYNCSSLTSITIPESVTSIGSSAFEGCRSLTSITIPTSVTSIDYDAFEGCTSLTSVTIPKGVTSIGSYAFYGCSSLQDVFFVGTEADRRAISINSNNTTLLNAEWHYINSVDEAFTISAEQPANGTITLSKTMCIAGMEITVGARPDAGYRLRAIIVDGEPIEGTSFTAGGNHVVTAEFEPYRTEGIIDSGTCGTYLTWTLYDDGELYIAGLGEMESYSGSYMRPDRRLAPWYEYCDQITSVIIEEDVTSIGDNAFYGCSSLTSIIIPEGVTSIGDFAFAISRYNGSSYPETAEFMGNAPELGSDVFPYTASGKFLIQYHSGTSGWTSPQWNGYYTECIDEPPTEFSTLDSENRNSQGILFTLNDTSNTATVGDNSTTANNSGYYGNNGGSIVIPAAVTKDGKQYNVIGIGQQAFAGNILLNTIELGSKITSVDPTAFSDCPNFTAFTVDPRNTYYSVDGGVLYDKNMYNLYCYPDGKTGETYQVPDTVNVIGRSVFSNNKYLTEIVVPDNVMSIGQEAFGSCENLASITLPFIGTSINADARFSAVFSYIPRSLKAVTITGGKLKEYSFYYYVYNSGDNWHYIEEINLPAGLTEIPSHCFQECYKLSVIRFGDQEVGPGRLVLPEGIKTIGYRAFWNCDSLTSVYMSESVTSVGSEAFCGCDKVESIYVSSSVASIGSKAFYNCPNCAEFTVDPNNKNYCSDKWGVLYNKSMTSLINYPPARKWPYYNIPDSVVRIESDAFYRCANLKNLYIPNSVVSMSGCISSCPGMTVCAYLDSTAYRYAGNNSLDVWPMDNYRLQGIEIYSLPEQMTFLQGTESFNGLYVVANGGKALQLDDYIISYDPKRVGTQEAVISYQGESVSFNITLYGADDHLIDFGQQNVSETDILFAAVYDTSGQMISVETGALVNGAVQLVVSDEVYQKMGEAKLFVLDGTTYEPTGVIATKDE